MPNDIDPLEPLTRTCVLSDTTTTTRTEYLLLGTLASRCVGSKRLLKLHFIHSVVQREHPG